MNKENFQVQVLRIKAGNSFDKVAQQLQMPRQGLRLYCPLCQSGGPTQHKSPDMQIYTDRGHCFKCSANIDIFSLVQHVRSCDFRTAVEFLGGITPNTEAGKRMRHPNKPCLTSLQNERRKQPIGQLRPFDEHWPLNHRQTSNHDVLFGHSQALLTKNPKVIEYLRLRGFSLELVKNFVGFLPQGQWLNPRRDVAEGRIVFPHYDYSDPSHIINLYGRAICSSCPKLLRHDHGYGPKGFFSANPQLALSAETLIVTEGVFDSLAIFCSCPAMDVGLAAVFGIQSFNFTHFPRAKRIIFAFDNDEPGITAVKKLALEGLLRGIEISTVPTAAYRGCKDLADSFLPGPLKLDF